MYGIHLFFLFRMMDPVVTYYGKGQLSGFPVDPNGVIDVVRNPPYHTWFMFKLCILADSCLLSLILYEK